MAMRSGIPLPREHGAWAMFLIPILMGIITAGDLDWGVLAFLVTAFGFFLFRYPIMLAVKSRSLYLRRHYIWWSLVYAIITLAAGILLAFTSFDWLLLPLGALGLLTLAIYLWRAAHRTEMTVWGEWIGIAGLALGAPGVYLVGTGKLDTTAIALYVLNVLYFGGTVLYVRYRVREQRLLAPDLNWLARLWAGRATVGYHVAASFLIAAAALVGMVPALVLLAFIPVLCKAIGGIVTLPLARPDIRQMGVIELAMTVIFAVVVLFAYYKT